MFGVVDIEIKTIDLVFTMLGGDINVLKTFNERGWTAGKKHYEERIEAIFKRLHEIEMMIDNVSNSVDKDIKFMETKAEADNSHVGYKHRMEKVKARFKSKLKHLSGLNWEYSIRSLGISEVTSDKDIVIKSVRRVGDDLVVHELD